MGNETRTRIVVVLVPIVSACCFVACCQGCGKSEESRMVRLKRDRANQFFRESEKHFENAKSLAKRGQYDDEIDEYTTVIREHDLIVKEQGEVFIRNGWYARLFRGICYKEKCNREHQFSNVQQHLVDLEPLPPDAQRAIADFTKCTAEDIAGEAYYYRAEFYLYINMFTEVHTPKAKKYLDMAIEDYRRAVDIGTELYSDEPDSNDLKKLKRGLAHALEMQRIELNR
jgi:tetratricopeptide (TPR) repeat protein